MNLDVQFQIIQPDKNNLNINVVGDKLSTYDKKKIHEHFRNIIGPGINIKFFYLNRIERDPSGKYGYVVSHVKRSIT